MSSGQSRRGLIWAIAGAVVLLIAIVAIIFSGTAGGPDATPASPSGQSSTTRPTATAPGASAQSAVVDSTVTKYGWLPEPITTNRDEYIRAALAAASTFDPSKSTRDKFLNYLATWFTPDTRRTSTADRAHATQLYLGELSSSVVQPDDQWTELRANQTSVTAKVTGPITYVTVPGDPGGMVIGTADVSLTYHQGGVTSDDRVRVSVQVLCGPGSVPAARSSQQAGDCKVIRYFGTAVEE